MVSLSTIYTPKEITGVEKVIKDEHRLEAFEVARACVGLTAIPAFSDRINESPISMPANCIPRFSHSFPSAVGSPTTGVPFP